MVGRLLMQNYEMDNILSVMSYNQQKFEEEVEWHEIMGRQYTANVDKVSDWEESPTNSLKNWDVRYEIPVRHKQILDFEGGPWAALVELKPNTVIEAHSHSQNQFQIFLEGTADLNGEEITPITIHYTDEGTPYGPIKAGERGVTWLVVRENAPTGYHPANK